MLTVTGITTKTNTTRYIPLNKTVLDCLQAWQPKDVDLDAYVFAGKDGARVVDIKTAWKALMTAAKVSNFRVHDLRHAFASNSCRQASISTPCGNCSATATSK